MMKRADYLLLFGVLLMTQELGAVGAFIATHYWRGVLIVGACYLATAVCVWFNLVTGRRQ
jgi:hypothetical protein